MRLLILSSSTGGGHDMRARSLIQWCEKAAPGGSIVATQYQALEDSAPVYRFGVKLYNWIQKRWPALHHGYFNCLECFQVSASPRLLLGKQRYTALLQATRPDIIVSVHAHTNHAFRVVAQATLPGVRFVTYCGEMAGGYGFSRHWADPGVDAFVGATPEICEAAVRQKLARSRTYCGGFLLNPLFYREDGAADAEARRLAGEWDLAPDRFTLLLSTGANGAVNHTAFLRQLEQSKLQLQVIALCAGNHRARTEIETMSKGFRHTSVRALGYQRDMCALMRLCDAMVARPGTGTTSEAILAGCPLLFNTVGGIMPQEWITVKFLRGRGLAAPLLRRPSDLPDCLRPLMQPAADGNGRHWAMRRLRPEPTPDKIVAFLRDLVSHGTSQQLPHQ